MKLLGFRSYRNYLLCISLKRRFKPHVLFLSKTKRGVEKFKKIDVKLGFTHVEYVDSKGSLGGLALFWLKDADLEICWKSENIM